MVITHALQMRRSQRAKNSELSSFETDSKIAEQRLYKTHGAQKLQWQLLKMNRGHTPKFICLGIVCCTLVVCLLHESRGVQDICGRSMRFRFRSAVVRSGAASSVD